MHARCGRTNRLSIVLFLDRSKKSAEEVTRKLGILDMTIPKLSCWIDEDKIGVTAVTDSSAILILQAINGDRRSRNHRTFKSRRTN